MGKSQAEIRANKALVRERLTTDPANWSRECVLPYPKEFEKSIDLLQEAAGHAARGNIEQAKQIIGQMQDAEMRSWFDDLAQNSGKVRLEILHRPHKSNLAKSLIKRPTKAQEKSIIRAQGFHCRYCGIRLVLNGQLKKLQDIVGYDVLPNRSQAKKKKKNSDIHGIWLITRATVDHVEPVSHGGLNVNREENLAACCWPCNYAKWKYTLEELEIDNPMLRPALHTDWSGLTDILP
jgi:5-methylcytosine-specific restriction endonuclease McrA